LNDDRDSVLRVSDSAQVVVLKEFEEHFGLVNTSRFNLFIVIFELDVKSDFCAGVDLARCVLLEHDNILNQLVHSDHLKPVVEHSRAMVLVALEPSEHLELGESEILNIPLAIISLEVLPAAAVLVNVCGVVEIFVMLHDQMTVFGDLEVHLKEISTAVVRIYEASEGLLWSMSKSAAMRNHKWSILPIEVFGFSQLC